MFQIKPFSLLKKLSDHLKHIIKVEQRFERPSDPPSPMFPQQNNLHILQRLVKQVTNIDKEETKEFGKFITNDKKRLNEKETEGSSNMASLF